MVNAEAGYVPLRTWYVRRASTADGMLAAAVPADEFRKAARASLLGARTVMLIAFPRVARSAGWV